MKRRRIHASRNRERIEYDELLRKLLELLVPARPLRPSAVAVLAVLRPPDRQGRATGPAIAVRPALSAAARAGLRAGRGGSAVRPGRPPIRRARRQPRRAPRGSRVQRGSFASGMTFSTDLVGGGMFHVARNTAPPAMTRIAMTTMISEILRAAALSGIESFPRRRSLAAWRV